MALFFFELLVAPIGGSVALGYLDRRPGRASGVIGAGLYALAAGVAFLIVFPTWNPSDNAILGTALLGGLLAMAGTGLALAGAAVLAGRSTDTGVAVGFGAGFVAFLLFTASGMVWPLFALHLPIVLAIVVLGGVLLVARRRLVALAAPVLLAALGTALTVGLLVARGPGGWAGPVASLCLYVMGVAIALGILDVSPEAVVLTATT